MGDSQKTRDLILQAAGQVFARRGVGEASLREIAREAGVRRRTLSRYFDSKEELFVALVKGESDELFLSLEAAIDGQETAVDKLRAFARTRLEYTLALTRYSEAMADEVPALQPLVLRVVREDRWKLQELLETVLRHGVASGELVVNEVESLARGLLFLMRGLDSAILFEGEVLGLELAEEQVLEAVIRGIERCPAVAPPLHESSHPPPAEDRVVISLDERRSMVQMRLVDDEPESDDEPAG